jgi:branched-chain amino acid transport system ATP-binding protein
MSLLEVKKVSSGYGSRCVLKNLSIEIGEGDIVALVGSNGSGKSTLLKTIYGLADLIPSSSQNGHINFRGEEISHFRPFELLNRGLLFIQQHNKGFDNLTVDENLKISGLALKNAALFAERYAEVVSYLPMLHALSSRKPLNMSGGELQFLALGMALLHRPKMILMDEPFAGLSSESIEIVKLIIRQLHSDQHITFLIAEHLLAEVLELTNRLIALESGHIVRDVVIDDTFDKDSLIPLLV